MTIKVERGVPIPRPNVPREILYPFDQLEVGDSFAVPNAKSRGAQQMMCLEHRRDNGKRFLSRIDGEKRRFWRIK